MSEQASTDAVEGGSHASGLGLLVAATGVVYGDIGTSPLYTLKEVFSGHYGVSVDQNGVFGILSLIVWSLLWVVSLKYVMFMLRADNEGEGGVMALTALARRAALPYPRLKTVLVLLGLFGAALFYGDSMITPAISVLSAVEGLDVALPGVGHWVVPVTVALLVGLFVIQKHGTGGVRNHSPAAGIAGT
jgi:KUP system potassium uptake protein